MIKVSAFLLLRQLLNGQCNEREFLVYNKFTSMNAPRFCISFVNHCFLKDNRARSCECLCVYSLFGTMDMNHRKTTLTPLTGGPKLQSSVHMRTGRRGLRTHLKRLGLADSARCECGSEEQTPEHTWRQYTNSFGPKILKWVPFYGGKLLNYIGQQTS